jgi:hypothetical protein
VTDTWRDCNTCRSIAADRRSNPRMMELCVTESEWARLDGSVPREVLLAMGMAQLHATHHIDYASNPDSILITGVRELVAHYTTEMVPRDEANERAAGLWNSWQAEVKEIRATADAEARASYEARLQEAQTRLLIVNALRHAAGTRKTMRAEDVRDALSWVQGEEVPEFAKAYHREMFGAGRGAA